MRNSDMNVHLSYIFFYYAVLNYFPILIHLLKEMFEEAKLINLTIKRETYLYLYICMYYSFILFHVKYRIVNYLH